MKNTQLANKHIGLNAKMVNFAGFNMPVSYTSIKQEHHAVRTGVGVFDVSHMGEFIVRGKEALQLLQYVTSNDVSKLKIGQAQYSCLPNSSGGIVDDLLIYRLPEDYCSEGEQAFMLVVNASNIEKDWEWINEHNKFDTKLINISDDTSLLAVQGPQAKEVIKQLTEINLDELKYYTFEKDNIAGLNNILLSATGYTGAGGFELYARNEQVESLWEAIFAAGEAYNIQPIGLGARDTLRLEMGYCLYGNDIDDQTSPIEAGLSWITKFNKGDFINRDNLELQKKNGVSKQLTGFVLEGRRVPRQGYTITNKDGNEIGKVTSGTMSPTLEQPIGMGYINLAHAKVGNEVFIQFNQKYLPAIITKPPFIKK